MVYLGFSRWQDLNGFISSQATPHHPVYLIICTVEFIQWYLFSFSNYSSPCSVVVCFSAQGCSSDSDFCTFFLLLSNGPGSRLCLLSEHEWIQSQRGHTGIYSIEFAPYYTGYFERSSFTKYERLLHFHVAYDTNVYASSDLLHHKERL